MSRYYNAFGAIKDQFEKFKEWNAQVERARMRWIKEDPYRAFQDRVVVEYILTCDWREIPVEYWRE